MLYPILTQSRMLIDLSGTWRFKVDDGSGFEKKWYEKTLDDAQLMPVPSSYNDIKESADAERSEERRVGKECRSRWSPYH